MKKEKISGMINAIDDFIKGDEKDNELNLNWRMLFGGEMFGHVLRRGMVYIIIVTITFLVSISNRYTVQQSLIQIESLKEQLKDIKCDAQTRSSELTERSRQSHIEEYLSEKGDSLLTTAKEAPYTIR